MTELPSSSFGCFEIFYNLWFLLFEFFNQYRFGNAHSHNNSKNQKFLRKNDCLKKNPWTQSMNQRHLHSTFRLIWQQIPIEIERKKRDALFLFQTYVKSLSVNKGLHICPLNVRPFICKNERFSEKERERKQDMRCTYVWPFLNRDHCLLHASHCNILKP